MLSGLLFGIIAGTISGSRWNMLIAPLAYVFAFELTRNGIKGPTVEGIHLSSTYGVISFITGRGVNGVLILAPNILGSAYGVWIAALLGEGNIVFMGPFARSAITLMTLALVAVALILSRPATTCPIMNSDNQPIQGIVAELITIPIDGNHQTMMIRGRGVDSPLLLYLAGGPGGTDRGAMRADVTIEEHFVVVTWDQRGAGKSYS